MMMIYPYHTAPHPVPQFLLILLLLNSKPTAYIQFKQRNLSLFPEVLSLFSSFHYVVEQHYL